MKVAVAAACFAGLFVAIEVVTRVCKLDRELSRKLAHILAGTSGAFLPEVMSFRAIMVLSLIFLPTMLVSRKLNLLGSIHSVGRRTLGEVYFPLGIFVTALAFPHRRQFIYGVLVMSLADGLAALLGQRYGRRRYRVWRGEKSYAGSAVFFVTAAGIGLAVAPALGVLWAVAAALILTAVEGGLSGGVDNLILPPLAAGLLVAAWRLLNRG